MGYPDHERKVSVVTELGMTRNVVLYDNHEGAMDWLVGGTGADPTIAKTGGRSFLGLSSLVMKTRVTSPAIGDVVTAERIVSYPVKSRLFVGFRASVSNITKVTYARIQLNIHNGVRNYQAAMAFSWIEPGLVYWSATNDEVPVAEGAGASINRAWHYVGAELDLKNFEWVRLVGNGADTDLSGKGLYNVEASSGKYVSVTLTVLNKLASAGECWIDTVTVCECEAF